MNTGTEEIRKLLDLTEHSDPPQMSLEESHAFDAIDKYHRSWLRSLLEERRKLLEALKRIAEQTEDEITEDYARSILSQYAINESNPDTATTSLG